MEAKEQMKRKYKDVWVVDISENKYLRIKGICSYFAIVTRIGVQYIASSLDEAVEKAQGLCLAGNLIYVISSNPQLNGRYFKQETKCPRILGIP